MNRYMTIAALTVAAALAIACAGNDADTGTPVAPATGKTSAKTGTIGEGTFGVPGDVKPGTYTATVPADSVGCYWARLKGLDGEFESIITNGTGNAGAKMIVTIKATDKGFETTGCGGWVLKK